MHILLASEFYHPSVGGVQEVMRQLAEHLVQRGHALTVATRRLPERTSRIVNGVQIEEFDVSGNLVHGMTGEVERYREYVLAGGYDLLMIKAAQQWTFDALTPVLRRIAKPKIFVPCGFSGLFDPLYEEYFHRMPEWMALFDRLIFYATDYRDINFARRHGLQRTAIVPNGADEREFNVPRDTAFRARHGITHDAFTILTVGSLTGLKGHLELSEAFLRCDFGGRPACLVLNGNLPAAARPQGIRACLGRLLMKLGMRHDRVPQRSLKERLKDLVDAINARPGRKALLTDFARGELVQAYLNSNLFAFASNIEYSPLVLYEAAAAGLPFLSVPVGNAAQIAEWTEGGVISPATVDEHGYTRVDPKVLAEWMVRLAADPDRLAKLAAAGRRNWEARFTWDTISRMYERLFEDCLQKVRA